MITTEYEHLYVFKNKETGEVEFVPLYSWTEKKEMIVFCFY